MTEALIRPRKPTVVNDARTIGAVRSGRLDIGTLWELCVLAEFDREQVPQSIATWLGPPDVAGTILDCACGSGFPAIDLDLLGYEIAASDGSQVMLEHFRRNVEIMGSTLSADRVLWSDLTRHYGESVFDVVMCRGGGNYLYNMTWDADGTPEPDSLTATFTQFFRCCKPGGRLYIDITRHHALDRTGPTQVEHPIYLVGGQEISLSETVTVDQATSTRRWETQISVGDRLLKTTRTSHLLRHEALRELLESVGFVDIEPEGIAGEGYDVFSARRP